MGCGLRLLLDVAVCCCCVASCLLGVYYRRFAWWPLPRLRVVYLVCLLVVV